MRKSFLLMAFCFLVLILKGQQWTVSYPVEEGVVLMGGNCNGEGNFIVGACGNDENFGYLNAFAMYVDEYGNSIDRKFCFEGYKSHFCNTVCLSDGNAFVVGVKGGTLTDRVYDTLWIAIMNQDLEVLEEHGYPLEAPYKTWTTDVYLDFNNNGEIIVLADVSERSFPYVTDGVYVVLKCDTHGNVLKSQYFAEGHGPNGARPTGIIRVPDSDNMMLIGKGFFVNGFHSICYIDNELNKVAAYPLQWLENNWNYTDCWKDEGHFLMSSVTRHYGMINNSYYAAVFEVDSQGHYIDTLVYDRADTSDYTAQFGSMAYINDDVIFVATYWENGQNDLPSDAVICLIDKDLNLKGTKRLKLDDTKIRIMQCRKTSDGGCVFYGQCRSINHGEMVCVWKLLPEDFVIPWSLDDEPVVLPHLQVYPNPVTNYLQIILQNTDNQSCVVTVYDVKGLKYFERKFENSDGLLTLDVTTLDDGMYFYVVNIGGQRALSGRFLKTITNKQH